MTASQDLSDREFLRAAEATLAAIEQAVEATGAEIDIERSGNVLTLACENGTPVIVNLQQPMRQIWVAARSGGFHYVLREGSWIDTRDGSELFAALSRILSQQAGCPMLLAARAAP